VPRSYHTLNKRGKMNERKLVEFLSKHGQQFLPMVELIEQSSLAVDDLIDSVGRVTLQTVLHMSAEQVAGPPSRENRASTRSSGMAARAAACT